MGAAGGVKVANCGSLLTLGLACAYPMYPGQIRILFVAHTHTHTHTHTHAYTQWSALENERHAGVQNSSSSSNNSRYITSTSVVLALKFSLAAFV
uniref:Secreted protein n=1 Tax=Trichogramma kaykai TaxID=54128 RepID=A0ABD2VUV1_9HYME